MKKIMEYMYVYGLSVVITCTIILIVLFIYSMFNDYTIWATTNDFGEHYLEMVLFISGLICFIYSHNKVKITKGRRST